MKTISVVILGILVGVNAEADPPRSQVKKEVNYTNCNSEGIGSMGVAYRIGTKGKEAGHLLPGGMNSKISVATDDGGNTEKFSYNDPFALTGGKTTVVMTRKDGRPVSIETQYDPNSPLVKGQESMNDSKVKFPGIRATGERFGYEGDKCQVVEKYSIDSRGKETVLYNAQLCQQLLSLAKETTAKKLMECKATFSKMGAAMRKAREEYAENGKNLEPAFMGLYGNRSKFKPNHEDYESMAALGSCNFYRSTHGLPVDPDTSAWGNSFGEAAFGAGVPFGAGMGFSGNGGNNAGGGFGVVDETKEKSAE